MNSEESQSEQRDWRRTIRKIGKKRGMLELWTGVIGTRAVENHNRMSQTNQEAENRYTRQALWGNDGEREESDDMGNTILGDVTNPTPIVVTGNQGNSNLLPLAAMALGVLIPGAGVAGAVATYLLTKGPDVVEKVPGFTDSTVKLGLGRIEDYLENER
jgi:hypothetical protein